MSGTKPKARESETGDKTKPDANHGEHGIVLDDKAQEQPTDRKRAQGDKQHR